MAVLLANMSSVLALIATSVCKMTPPHLPASSEISCLESTGSPAWWGSKIVESIVSKGLVIPIVNTTIKRAMPATLFRGVLMTGESWEMLSRPEKARNAPAYPIKMKPGVSVRWSNMLGNNDKKEENEIWGKTVISIATLLPKEIIAATKLTFALSLRPIQFRRPSNARTTMVMSSNTACT